MPDSASVRPLIGRQMASPDGRVLVTPLPSATRFALRAKPEQMQAAGVAFGVALPTTACRAQASGTRAALWLGPDEWLLLAEAQAEAAIKAAFAAITAPLSLVEISHRNIAIELRGEGVTYALAAGCPLDLDLSAFPVGACTRTLFGKCEVVLWRSAPVTFRMEFWRSYADYVWALLAIACADAALPTET